MNHIRIDTSKPVDFHAATFPDSVYIGQQTTYQVAVILEQYARGKLRRDPQFKPPALRGLLAYELGRPTSMPAGEHDGQMYLAHVFQRALFGITPSGTTIPPAQLSYEASRTSGYFSRTDQYVVNAESVYVVVKPLPSEGKPADFTGAVGVLQVAARVDTLTARVGDPLVLTVTVSGTGNVKLFPRPTVELPWGSLLPAGEKVTVDSSGPLVRGSKEFSFILTPEREGAVFLPPIDYPYFDPYKEKYEVAKSDTLLVKVASGSLVPINENAVSRNPALREWRGTEVTPAYHITVVQRWMLLIIWIGAALIALISWLSRRCQIRSRPVQQSVVSLSELRTEPTGTRGKSRELRRQLLERLAARLNVPVSVLMRNDDLERVLRQRGVTRDSVSKVIAALDSLSLVAFGDFTIVHSAEEELSETQLEQLAKNAEHLVNQEAVEASRFSLRLGRNSSVLALLLACLTLLAPKPSPGQSVVSEVTEARQAYDARSYPAAAAQFAQAVASRPNDVDLLDSWGVASWMAGDTVSAVIAWQRAARLEPMAGDLQEHLALLPIGARTGIAAVPMIPIRVLGIGATVLWCVGMLVLVLVQRRQRVKEHTVLRASSGVALITAAIGMGTMALYGVMELDPRSLAVAKQPEQMRISPASDAATMGGLATGDVLRVLTGRTMWAQVEHSDGRVGWVPSAGLTPVVQAGPTQAESSVSGVVLDPVSPAVPSR